jgi:uncharacterized membrane protein
VPRTGRVAAIALLGIGVVAGVAVPLAACGTLSAAAPVSAALRLSYALGSVVCHQRPDRSFFSCGVQWPVCGRCAGLYMGFALAGFVGLARVAAGRAAQTTDDTRWWRRVLLLAAVPTAVLWLVEFAGGFNPGSVVRWAGALPLGIACACWLAAVARGDLR